MRIVYMLTLLIMMGISDLSAQRAPLYLIREGGKFGYVNKDKKIVITPRFFAAYNFWEGLAPVREAGLYGYIDTSGHYVIPPRFEQALPFHGGLARVYENGKPVYIDKSGHKAFDDVYVSVRTFNDNRAIVVDSQYHTGVIDTRGKMIVEPAFDYLSIADFQYGHAYANTRAHGAYFIDTMGKKIDLPYQYDKIERAKGWNNTKSKLDGVIASREPFDDMELIYTANGQIEISSAGDFSYMDSSGLLAQHAPSYTLPYNKNIDYLEEINYRIDTVSSPEIKPEDWENYPKKITSADTLFPAAKIGILAVPDAKIVADERYNGHKVFVFNAGQKTATLLTTHDRLLMWLEALTKDNEWVPLETTPRGNRHFSSNFIRQTSLPAQSYWELNCPVYEGTFKTKMRYAMCYLPKADNYASQVIIYSNEFSGSINPGQLLTPLYESRL